MGSRYPEEEAFSFYNPEQDYEGLRGGPRYRPTPISPQGPISPRAPPPGIYPPEINHDYYNRARLPGSSREQPFGPYDVEQDFQGRPRQGMDVPLKPLEAELGYYNPGPRSPKDFDSRSKGVGGGATPPPLYVNPNFDHLSMSQGAPPNGGYGPGASPNDSYGQGALPNDSYGRRAPLSDGYRRGASQNENYARGTPPNDISMQGASPNDISMRGASPNDSYARGAPLNDKYGRGAPLHDSYAQGTPPNDKYTRGVPLNDSYGRGAPPNNSYGRGVPPNDGYGRGAPPNDGYGQGAPPIDNYGRGAPPIDNYGRGAPPNDSYGRGAPPNDNYGQGAPPIDSYGRGAPPNESYEQGTSPHGSYGHGAPPDGRYEHEAPPNNRYGREASSNDTYGQGSSEFGYGGREGISRRAPPGTLGGNSYGAPASGTKPPYGREDSSGYARGIGRGQRVAPLGDGRYEYGGLHQPERLDEGASPAPISSEYAHQVYASVFSDPVYGGARQLNSQAGYHEQPDSVQQAHHREDVRRHPDDF